MKARNRKDSIPQLHTLAGIERAGGARKQAMADMKESGVNYDYLCKERMILRILADIIPIIILTDKL